MRYTQTILKTFLMRYKGLCILLNWFRSQGNDNSSRNRLDRICKSIEITLEENLDPYKLEKYINPLLAIGFIEYQTNARYCLAPTIAIKSIKDTVLINFPKSKLPDEYTIIEESYSGHLIRIKSKATRLKIDCLYKKTNQIIFKQHPKFKQVVESWESCNIPTERYHTERLGSYGWEKKDVLSSGVYRIKDEVGSQKILKLENSKLLIPANNSIDSFAIAYQITNHKDPFSYNADSETLEINTFLFPVIVQRLLIHMSHFRFEYKENRLFLSGISKKNYKIIKNKFNA